MSHYDQFILIWEVSMILTLVLSLLYAKFGPDEVSRGEFWVQVIISLIPIVNSIALVIGLWYIIATFGPWADTPFWGKPLFSKKVQIKETPKQSTDKYGTTWEEF